MDLSIITPCYNHGQYLDDMLESVHNNNWSFDFEHIIINDGSTDVFTLNKLIEIQKAYKVTVVNQQNRGLSATRNIGINLAKGKFILPLDSDNKINTAVFGEAVEIMEQNPHISVIYTNAQYFGEKNGVFITGEIDPDRLLNVNQLDACALINKSVFDRLGGYDEEMRWGSEDWDMWLRIFFSEGVFYYLNKIGFYYRIRGDSMTSSYTTPKYQEIKTYLIQKYFPHYVSYLSSYFDKYLALKSQLFYIKNNKLKALVKYMLGKKLISI